MYNTYIYICIYVYIYLFAAYICGIGARLGSSVSRLRKLGDVQRGVGAVEDRLAADLLSAPGALATGFAGNGRLGSQEDVRKMFFFWHGAIMGRSNSQPSSTPLLFEACDLKNVWLF